MREFWMLMLRDDRDDPPGYWRNVAGSTEKDHMIALAQDAIARGSAALVAKIELWEFPGVAALDGPTVAGALLQ